MIQVADEPQRAISATCWAEIDLSVLRTNVEVLRRQAEPAGVAAVVKADAYGHGAVAIALAALEAGAERLCVFTVREAVELREAGIAAPILCLGPVLNGDSRQIAEHDIAAVVDSDETAIKLASAALEAGVRVRAHINIDSGMQRYGLAHDRAVALAEQVRATPSLDLEAVFTHFPDAANADRSGTHNAFRRFQRTADQIGAPMRHAAASAATFNLPQSSLDFVRAGIALYGMDPAPELKLPEAQELHPVMSWKTSLLAIRQVRQGESVSYGGLWTAHRDSRIGIIGAGYADGLRRRLGESGAMLVRGQRAPIRGAICMDSTMIDLTDITDAAAGDTVTIIGRDGSEAISAWDLARQLDTIPYEIFTSISARVPRLVVDPANSES
ncbi:MAG: alanine racemase [Chloroflexi bacterium]|nr:alanine racemase [Chloroflexota bacterium]